MCHVCMCTHRSHFRCAYSFDYIYPLSLFVIYVHLTAVFTYKKLQKKDTSNVTSKKRRNNIGQQLFRNGKTEKWKNNLLTKWRTKKKSFFLF